MINPIRLLLTLLLSLAFSSTATAYAPPPAGNLIWLMPRLTVELPPLLIYVPRNLRFAGNNYSYNSQNEEFVKISGSEQYGVRTRIVDRGTDGAYISLSITGFRKDKPPLADWRLTFNESTSKSNIEQLASYLKNHSSATSALTAAGCVVNGASSHLCLKTISTIRAPRNSPSPVTMFETIALKGIFVQGNVAAADSLDNFIIDDNAIALGGSINVQGEGVELEQYLLGSSKLNWNSVNQDIKDLYKRGIGGTHLQTRKIQGYWNLNSSSRSPSGTANSFSAPPEGKLWYSASGLVLGDISFTGSGTIVVNGDLSLNGEILCSNQIGNVTRLAFLVNGSVSINTDVVNCGAFVAIGGEKNINFNLQPAKSGTLRGIFVAGDSIKLPNPEELTGPYIIDYDAQFANDPTILFRELLQMISYIKS
ncbi:hypothetical protein A3A71_02705 [Candidatus Berkelbacteria bacterium RIFCSPLOWO2_01_FULL_50_28]|uniref:Uncharacterized protein n=1 Tax=Candidatus Berkelbacteria bacterium RIFCSPLOWO2_01_FULL_50_28 TaxID=1797471 RepID=A0A1F5EBZ5_9BACT|nr:MAG: hypothetical protein A2807_02195 [Candidatus Berkelbacteria bacterium RIFCSPHIGHO2_01_FULL_50_36]OGD62620.1 MAG: hypothetical protein A3F39_02785 [Candidatus Berkelbacteria bacterium RIFCSPHIGHO2_12_FULL_50_11]OGD64932.1 MAG: hypothetical protein A3A71_02705 [Candidatus Berkelbacteria bacterium RIFCSPLOWO2_01_FULL_50_28]